MKKNFKKNRQKGFSLVEVLLVVFILSTALTVFIQVISKSIVHSIESQDSIIAAGLAQEGVELVKNIRDNNWAKKETVFDGLETSPCIINYNRDTCVPGSYDLKFNNDGFYNHDAGETTKFFRKIEINKDDLTKREVTSYVIWSRPWSGSGFSTPTSSNCYIANKCVYAKITLTQWGGE